MRDMRDFVFLILFGFVVVVAQGIKTKWRFQKVGFVLIVQSRFHHCRKYKFLYVTPITYQVFYIVLGGWYRPLNSCIERRHLYHINQGI